MISVGEDDDDKKREAVKTSAISKTERLSRATKADLALSRLKAFQKGERRDDLYKKRETFEKERFDHCDRLNPDFRERENERNDHLSLSFLSSKAYHIYHSVPLILFVYIPFIFYDALSLY